MNASSLVQLIFGEMRSAILDLLKLSVLCTISFACSNAESQTADEAKFDKKIERKVTLVQDSMSGTSLTANVDIGSVPANSLILLKLSVENPFQRQISIRSVSSGCRCLSSEMRGELPPNSKTQIEVTLKTQRHSSTLDLKQYLRFSEENEDVGGINLAVSYSLEGLLSFTEGTHYERHSTSAVERGVTFSVPFVFSSPVSLRDVRIELTNQLENCKSRLIEKDGRYFVQLDFKGKTAGESLPGEIIMTERHAKSEARIPIYLQVENKVSLSPKSLRFVWSDSIGAYSAMAMVRVNEKDGGGSELDVRCWLPDSGGAKVTAKTKKLNDRIARIEYVLDFGGERFQKDQFPNFKKKLAVEVVGFGAKFSEDQELELID